MTFHKFRTYWLEHPQYGTFEAELVITSTNRKSLGFNLKETLLVKTDSPIPGIIFAKFLPLMNDSGVLTDLVSGSVWTAYTSEPSTKIPTK